MSETAHTPLPWRFDGDWYRIPTIYGADGKHVASVQKVSRELPGEDNIANAAMIVTAVNERPALIAERDALARRVEVMREALTEIAEWPHSMVNDSESLRFTLKQINRTARAALNAAKETS
jgi:hypothetical protein